MYIHYSQEKYINYREIKNKIKIYKNKLPWKWIEIYYIFFFYKTDIVNRGSLFKLKSVFNHFNSYSSFLFFIFNIPSKPPTQTNPLKYK